MAVYADTKVWRALSARLASLTWSPAVPVSWPNMPFTPPTNHIWLRVNEFPASTTPFDVKGGTSDRTGLIQIDVFRPLNEGNVNEIGRAHV